MFAKSPSGFYILWSKFPTAFPLRKEQDKVLREPLSPFLPGHSWVLPPGTVNRKWIFQVASWNNGGLGSIWRRVGRVKASDSSGWPHISPLCGNPLFSDCLPLSPLQTRLRLSSVLLDLFMFVPFCLVGSPRCLFHVYPYFYICICVSLWVHACGVCACLCACNTSVCPCWYMNSYLHLSL